MKIVVSILVVVAIVSASDAGAGDSGRFLPSSSPVSLVPSGADQEYYGFGTSVINMDIDWDDFYLTLPGTHTGKIELEARDFCLGFSRSRNEDSVWEADLMIGTITTSSGDAQYTSEALGATVSMNIDGSGINIGGRCVYSHNIWRWKSEKGAKIVDWNLAYSLHMAYFTMENKAVLKSVTGQNVPSGFPSGFSLPGDLTPADLGSFGEDQSGLFARALIAFQPIVYAGDRIKLLPFVGVGTKESLTSYKWNKLDTSLGREIESLLSPRNSTELENWGINTIAGFDISVTINKRLGHELTLGSSISKISGNEDSDFAEQHILYKVTFGK